MLCQHGFNDPGDLRKVQLPVEERLHRDLVGGIEYRRLQPARPGRRLRQRQARNRSRSGARKSRRAVLDRDRGILHRRRCAPATPAHARSACACRASRAAPAPSRPRTRPASARCSAGARRPRPARRSAPNSRQRLDELEALVHQRGRIDRDLAAHDPVGMRAGLLGRARRRAPRRPVEERAAGGGEQHAAHARAALAGARVSRGRHWKIALCSLSIGHQRRARGAHGVDAAAAPP